jgi:hypothetical protein
MFWRHPTGRAAGGNWPKCSAILRGEVVDLGKKVGEAKTNLWMHAVEIKQPGTDSFVKVDGEGCWMPLEIQKFVLQDVKQ